MHARDLGGRNIAGFPSIRSAVDAHRSDAGKPAYHSIGKQVTKYGDRLAT